MKQRECKYCNQNFNERYIHLHQSICTANQNRIHRRGMLGKKGSNQFIKAKQLGLPKPTPGVQPKDVGTETKRKNGTLKHSEETKQKLSLIACNRLKKHSKYTKNVEYRPGIFPESTYEVRVAEILDQLNIRWSKEECRLGYIWDDNGKTRRYIPDFYLPDYKIFLDPKNDYLIKRDQKKIDSACKINSITVYVLSNSQITEEYIRNLIKTISTNNLA